MVKQKDEFYEHGCSNCKFLALENDYERIQVCTTENFQGFIAMADPRASWVSRWQRLGAKFSPGCYAISVTGTLPGEIIEEIEDSGFKYLSRDTSV
jgi:transcription elongation factor SPT4